jgi:hypothetical protein
LIAWIIRRGSQPNARVRSHARARAQSQARGLVATGRRSLPWQYQSYRELKAELAALVGEVNGRHGEVDWMPIRYLNKGFSQLTLAGFYRVASVGLVTIPLHDGIIWWPKNMSPRKTHSIRVCWCCHPSRRGERT